MSKPADRATGVAKTRSVKVDERRDADLAVTKFVLEILRRSFARPSISIGASVAATPSGRLARSAR
jgi:hypothetical protein